ncbi:MAG: helix-turn-helix domain-containing protein [Clostridiales bacterium]|jgi:DNA-binding winged helix-turn-helix (wHTH) protein|nr:helix-turn-helix domain-containing protein [Clostridiales bacterium]
MYHTFHASRYQKRIEINELFQSVVQQDKARRFDQLNVSVKHVFLKEEVDTVIKVQYENQTHTVEKKQAFYSLSNEEKNHVADQVYLQKKNPVNASVLDSLFHNELEKRGISAQTAVICTVNKLEIQYSSPDTSFYASAIRLENVPIIASDEIELQAFVRIPFSYWLTESKSVYMSFLLLWLLSTGSIVRYLYRKKRNQLSLMPLTIVSDTEDTTGELFFDKRRGCLIYKRKAIQLGGMQLEIFTYLLDAPSHFLSYEEIKKVVWKDNNVSQNTINKSIQRLRSKLSAVPGIAIHVSNKKGCQLNIHKCEDENGLSRLIISDRHNDD